MNKKIKLLVAIIIFLIASQWLAVRMVYSHKLNGAPAVFFAKLYNLKAGTIEETDKVWVISLADYLRHKEFVSKYIVNSQDPAMSTSDADIMAWNRMLKNTWLNKIGEAADLLVSDEELELYLQEAPNIDELKKEIEEELDAPFDDYLDLMVRPLILEAKVYDYLIYSFGDTEGVTKVQEAYIELEEGGSFMSVAEKYSDEKQYLEGTIWVSQDEVAAMYEPVKDLEVGEFSKIVQIPGAYGIPGGYMIWRVESIAEDEGKTAKELRGLFVAAKEVDQFLFEYLEQVTVNKIY